MPNVFENNEHLPNDAEDHKAAGDDPHILLPPLQDGHAYSIEELPSGRQVVKVKEVAEPVRPPRDPEVCGCSRYQSCSKCGVFESNDPNSPESRTLRHAD